MKRVFDGYINRNVEYNLCLYNFSGFTLLYLIFLIIGTIERVKYTFTNPKLNKIGRIYYNWTFILLLIIYVLIVLFSIIEYFVIVKAVNPYVSIAGIFIFLSGVCLRRKAGGGFGL